MRTPDKQPASAVAMQHRLDESGRGRVHWGGHQPRGQGDRAAYVSWKKFEKKKFFFLPNHAIWTLLIYNGNLKLTKEIQSDMLGELQNAPRGEDVLSQVLQVPRRQAHRRQNQILLRWGRTDFSLQFWKKNELDRVGLIYLEKKIFLKCVLLKFSLEFYVVWNLLNIFLRKKSRRLENYPNFWALGTICKNFTKNPNTFGYKSLQA